MQRNIPKINYKIN